MWEPNLIDIEAEFTRFVGTYRGGKTLEKYFGKIPEGTLNADFIFEGDQVIGELKCMSSDPNEKVMKKAERISKSFDKEGYTGSDLFGSLFRGEPVPKTVKKRLFNLESRSILEALKKANRQLRATKKLLVMPKAKGVTFLANDRNFGFTPAEITSIICKAFKQFQECHTDCVVYFTPNVYHDFGDDVAHTLWFPIYDVGSEGFGDYINPLGSAWLKFHESLGSPYISEQIGDGEELFNSVLRSKPINFKH